ncbi:MAG: excinuclease ABC subunit UvrA, partial [Deltaproteobacteria bacterium]|nr:excinuclease ABC subunit UvrA [Deltaproteobacteria bacterium]
TVYVVEHDQETIASADHVVDLGPGAGSQGGHVLAQGSVAQVMAAPDSLSGRYLSGEMTIAIPKQRRVPGKAAITIHGARRNNLQNLTVRLPLGVFVAVTGVSGSGKSTLVHDLLKPALSRYLDTPGAGDAKGTVTGSRTGDFSRITGLQHLDKVIEIDQTPIGRTPRSNPATYTKVLDPIRELFTQVPEARIRGYKPGRFSFNVKGGRCETCEGAGIRTIEMQFLSDVEVVCEDCQGRRFNEETLGIHYKGRSIHDVLEMSVDQASEFFAPVPAIAHILNTLQNVGLGYIKLGQPSTTLSGGEAQRMKLASELRKRGTGRTLYLLDEPTTGLHFHDIRTLLNCLNILVEQGNTVLVIEHNLDVIKVADWLIDLGPGGGKHGGRLVAQGTPEDLAALTGTPTGSVLAEVLQPQALPAGTRAAPTRPPRHDVMVYGAAQHNLKHLEVRIPRNRLTVVTGVSGSGKTSLAFDTLFAEGQARYVESLSTYARRFLGRMDKARVDRIEGLAPAIAIDQKNSGRSPRSTVATVTEIYDYLRLLYARIGTPHCPHCGQPLEGHTPSRLARLLVESRPGERVILLAPLYRPDSTRPTMLDDPAHLPQLARALRTEGFNRLHLGGAPVELEDYLAKLSPQAASTRGSTKTTLKATAKTAATPKPKRGRKGASSGALAVDLVLDRTRITPGDAKRLAEALETGFEKGHGLVRLVFPDAASTAPVATSNTRTGAESDRSAGEWLVSRQLGCVACDYYQEEELTPRMFSFNSHVGACETCSGLGQSPQVDPERLVAFPQFPLLKGALVPGKLEKTLTRASSASERIVRAFAQREGIDVDLPFRKLSPEAQDLLLYGDGQRLNFTRRRAFSRGMRPASTTFKGLVGMVMALHEGEHREEWREHTSLVMADVPCRACGGERLKAAYRAVTLNGRSISNYCQLTVEQALADLGTWPLSAAARQVADQPFQEIRSRLGFLKDVGLGYLSLNREATTLSGGEAQRIRLASQLGAHLVGVLYVLDEPTIGLHPRDTGRLLDTLRRLRDLGNTVVVVEHDPETIRAADHVLDIGPGAGHLGGEVVAEGTPAQVKANIRSLTGAYLSGRKHIPIPQQIRTADPARTLHLKGARANNLKNVDAVFPLGLLTCVTGVSGSGKSSLVVSVLQRALEQRLTSARVMPGAHDALMGVAHLDSLVVIDQSPIGRSPKSNPATYTGVMDRIRALMAATRMARERGYTPGRFSFNVAGGRCEACEGRGFNHIEMHFLADVWVPCDVCAGKRYNRETLEVLFRGKSIAEILDLEIAQALELFEYQPVPRRALQTVVDVGLGYMKLGQAANTLSGGEAQRLKLAAELSRPATGRTVYILDEPTTGLHMDDTAKLLKVLHRLADQGNTVIVIEHNLDVIKTADRVIDLGPEGGDAGGHIIGIGSPAELTRLPGSHTGRALAPLFSR